MKSCSRSVKSPHTRSEYSRQSTADHCDIADERDEEDMGGEERRGANQQHDDSEQLIDSALGERMDGQLC